MFKAITISKPLILVVSLLVGLLVGLVWFGSHGGDDHNDSGYDHNISYCHTKRFHRTLTGNEGRLKKQPAEVIELSSTQVELRRAYTESRLPAQIRLQHDLLNDWNKSLPHIKTQLHEIANGDAPDGYRIFLAGALQCLFKSDFMDIKEQQMFIDGARTAVKNSKLSESFRARIALILSSIDNHAQSVEAVSTLLQTKDDQIAETAVRAISSIGTYEAVEQLYSYLSQHVDEPDAMPSSTIAALAPLIATNQRDVFDFVARIAISTNNRRTYSICLSALAGAASSRQVLLSIAAIVNAEKSSSVDRKNAEKLCREAMKMHEFFIKEHVIKNDKIILKALKTLHLPNNIEK